MGFFSGYTEGPAVAAVLSGLGKLTRPGSNAPNKDARQVVAAFVRGEPARGACSKKHGCEIVATGSELKVGDLVLAKRPASASAHISVCIPDRGEMVKLKSGKTVEVQKSKDVRAAAGALLRAVGTGLGVRTDKAGIRRLVGAHGKRATEMPGACLVVKLNPHQAAIAAGGMSASQEAQMTFTKQFPTRKQVASVRKMQARAKKMHALEKAHAGSLARRVAAAAKKEAAALAKAAKRFSKSGKRGWVAQASSKKAAKRFEKSGRTGWNTELGVKKARARRNRLLKSKK